MFGNVITILVNIKDQTPSFTALLESGDKSSQHSHHPASRFVDSE
jgi:hypothetical protein